MLAQHATDTLPAALWPHVGHINPPCPTVVFILYTQHAYRIVPITGVHHELAAIEEINHERPMALQFQLSFKSKQDNLYRGVPQFGDV
jgi:hypothetical protein